MVDGREAEPGREEHLTLPEKVARLHQALTDADIDHAFGGATAGDYYRVPRGTVDIDLNLFISPEKQDDVLDVLEGLFEIPGEPLVRHQITEQKRAVTRWGTTRIDLFFSTGAFHESVAKRVVEKESPVGRIPVLSPEDLIVFKVLHNRTQDWADIEAICELQAKKQRVLETEYMMEWLGRAYPEGSDRVMRLRELLPENARE